MNIIPELVIYTCVVMANFIQLGTQVSYLRNSHNDSKINGDGYLSMQFFTI